MKIVSTVQDLNEYLNIFRKQKKTIGFAPTMGALHEGHMSLMQASNMECDISVCSIFVNPTQFNEASDLEKYPRRLDQDAALLKKNGVDIIFAPSVGEVYPNTLKSNLNIDFQGLDQEMEGEFRPGHFEGVAQVVHRLLEIVEPDCIYMGQKDFQQFSIIQHMITVLQLPVKLRVVSIEREDTGLAMSSRNLRLSKETALKASNIYKTLKAVKRKKYQMPIAELEAYAMDRLGKVPHLKPEYFTIADGYTLQKLKGSVRDYPYVVACTAIWADDVRLIDNMILRKPRQIDLFV